MLMDDAVTLAKKCILIGTIGLIYFITYMILRASTRLNRYMGETGNNVMMLPDGIDSDGDRRRVFREWFQADHDRHFAALEPVKRQGKALLSLPTPVQSGKECCFLYLPV